MTVAQELQRAAIEMIAAADHGRSVSASFKKHCPHILRQARRDAAFPKLLAFWGRCVNFDEHAKQVIVHPAILEVLGEAVGIPVRGRFVHAGLQHTYGYLFSVIETPYGSKRDRWVSDDLEKGLGIDRSLLGVRPARGTLLANVTWVLGQIALRGRPAELKRLESQAAAVAPDLVKFDFSTLERCRIVERTTLPASRREVSLVTDLVKLPHAPDGDRLLIYSTMVATKALRLVTAFPMKPDAADRLVATAAVGGKVEVELRYNAYVRGLHGRRRRGSISIVQN